jgi:hypothetical protein
MDCTYCGARLISRRRRRCAYCGAPVPWSQRRYVQPVPTPYKPLTAFDNIMIIIALIVIIMFFANFR